MILYDGDDKLCVASDNMLRLWDFYDNREVPPQLWASQEFVGETIQRVFLNENSRGPFIFVVVTDKQFYTFEERLSLRSKNNLDAKFGSVLTVAFDAFTTLAYLGTTRGYVVPWSLATGRAEGEPFLTNEEGLSVSQIQRFVGISESVFLVTVGAKKCYVYCQAAKKGE